MTILDIAISYAGRQATEGFHQGPHIRKWVEDARGEWSATRWSSDFVLGVLSEASGVTVLEVAQAFGLESVPQGVAGWLDVIPCVPQIPGQGDLFFILGRDGRGTPQRWAIQHMGFYAESLKPAPNASFHTVEGCTVPGEITDAESFNGPGVEFRRRFFEPDLFCFLPLPQTIKDLATKKASGAETSEAKVEESAAG